MMRSGGILLPIFSLPSPYGIGTMGKEARKFIDFLQAAGQRYWQILPVCPTSYGDSPYQTFSTFAGNPYFIDLRELTRMGLLTSRDYREIDWEDGDGRINYGAMYRKRYPVLRKAYQRFKASPSAEFQAFCQCEAAWLEDYALFMALKETYGGAAWQEWPEPLRSREEKALDEARAGTQEEREFWKFVQYLFYSQWAELKEYAGSKGISIIGDLPIYVSGDSVDVWANPGQFQLDGSLKPIEVAGCPPDGFSADGQLWGNPLFDWEAMRADGYQWWIRRVAHQCRIYDMVRIDHFRGFDAYYAIPYGAPNAKIGRWREGPGIELFQAIEAALGQQAIIAEDLGFLTDGVRQLLRDSGYPGMKVLEFAFDSRENSDYLPHNYGKHCVVYTGTHDNSTIMGWMASANPEDIAYATEYLRLNAKEGFNWGMMRGAWSSVGDLAVVQMQDILGLDDSARMNIPSTVGENWRWRMPPRALTARLAKRLRHQMEIYRRL